MKHLKNKTQKTEYTFFFNKQFDSGPSPRSCLILSWFQAISKKVSRWDSSYFLVDIFVRNGILRVYNYRWNKKNKRYFLGCAIKELIEKTLCVVSQYNKIEQKMKMQHVLGYNSP